MIVFSDCVYALIEPRSTLSYVSLFIAGKLRLVEESFDWPFILYTSVGEPIVDMQVYRGCSIKIIDRDLCRSHRARDGWFWLHYRYVLVSVL